MRIDTGTGQQGGLIYEKHRRKIGTSYPSLPIIPQSGMPESQGETYGYQRD